jgi:hypothetical protein
MTNKKPFEPDDKWPFPDTPVKTMHGVERKDRDGRSYVKVTEKLLTLKPRKKQ